MLLYKLCFFTTPFEENTLAIARAKYTLPASSSKYSANLLSVIRESSFNGLLWTVKKCNFSVTGSLLNVGGGNPICPFKTQKLMKWALWAFGKIW